MSYEEELEKLHRQIDESKISVAEEQEREDSINKDLFRKMERIIKDEKLYLMPELVRQDMLARLSVDKNRFAQMLQENTNMTFSLYGKHTVMKTYQKNGDNKKRHPPFRRMASKILRRLG